MPVQWEEVKGDELEGLLLPGVAHRFAHAISGDVTPWMRPQTSVSCVKRMKFVLRWWRCC